MAIAGIAHPSSYLYLGVLESMRGQGGARCQGSAPMAQQPPAAHMGVQHRLCRATGRARLRPAAPSPPMPCCHALLSDMAASRQGLPPQRCCCSGQVAREELVACCRRRCRSSHPTATARARQPDRCRRCSTAASPAAWKAARAEACQRASTAFAELVERKP